MTDASFLQRLALPMAAPAMALGLLAAGPGQAETLRVGYYIGESHPLAAHGIRPFMEEVRERTNGAIDFQVFPAGQLFSPGDAIRMMQSGVVDIGLIVMVYHREEFPLSQAITLPLGWETWAVTNTFMRASINDGLIRDEWERNGMVPIMFGTNAPYEIHTANTPLPDLSSIAGMQIRSPGGVYDNVFSAMGAVPVAIPTPETYSAIERGTIDASVYAFSNWAGLNLNEVLRHTTLNSGIPGPGGLTFAISSSAYERLTPEQREIILEAGRAASISSQTAIVEMNESALEQYRADGLNVYEWSDEDLQVVRGAFDAIRDQWVASQDAAGRQGAEALAQLLRFHEQAADNPTELPER